MTVIDEKTLCMKLIYADSEDEVVKILGSQGYWNNSDVWRNLGDNENNFSTAGAQQSEPVAALVEKLVNSADARLMNECLLASISPSGLDAPSSVRHAVAQFIEKSSHPESETNGLIENWSRERRNIEAQKITLATTGSKSKPSITIVDQGEGQTPNDIPNTFMSLNKSNKLRVPFVQGKFNMGGTGALRFCGDHRIQLVVTRRNPAILSSSDADTDFWGFTVVRRFIPKTGERSSVYRYLAPLQIDGKKQVLRFKAERLSIMPD